MAEQANLRDYLSYVYDYYVACAFWRNKRPDPSQPKDWPCAAALVKLRDQAERLATDPPWSVQWLPSKGLFRITSGHIKDVLGADATQYGLIRDDLYDMRSGFYTWTTEETERRGWRKLSAELQRLWSGAVFSAFDREMLYFFVTGDDDLVSRLVDPDDLGRGLARGRWIRTHWDEGVRSMGGDLPLEWVGTDVTALLGAQARIGLVDDQLIVPETSKGYVRSDPAAADAFEKIITALTNPTGLYFEERNENTVEGPLHQLWLNIARKQRALYPMKTQRNPVRLPDNVRIPMGAKILKNRIKGEELTLMAKWVAFQVHHEKILELFWRRNDFDVLERTWRACEPLGMEAHLAAMREQEIGKVGATRKNIPNDWSGDQFGVAYLAWSLVKGCGISHAWPSDLMYCVHRQRQHCVSAGLGDVTEEDTQLTTLFPWGAILQSLDGKLYEETSWLYEVVLALRKRTIDRLGGLQAELRDIDQRIDASAPGSVTLGHRSQTEVVREFAHRELKAVLPEAERYYPEDRRVEYIGAFTAIALDEKKLPAQERNWLRLAKRTYRKQSNDDGSSEHRPTVFDYENTITSAIIAADSQLEAFLQHHGYLK